MAEVKFNGYFREGKYNQCDCCMAVDRVAVIEIPITRYTKESGYKEKATYTRTFWMCDDCRKALTRLLNRLEEQEDDI